MHAFKRVFQNSIPALFVLLWSTGFLGAKYGLPYAEPYTLLFLRFLLAWILLAMLVAYFRPQMPTGWRQRLHLLVSGGMIHGAYLGGVFTAIKMGMSAGLCALLVGLQPLLTTVLMPWLFGRPVSAAQWTGILLGLAGIVLLLTGGSSHLAEPVPASAVIAAIIALAGITAGTLYQKKFCSDNALLSGTLFQYVSPVILFGAGAGLFETMEIRFTHQFLLALAWLVVGLSIGAVLLLMHLIKHGESHKVASFFYLVPAVTAIEAFFLFGEGLGLAKVFGIGIVAVSVRLVTKERRSG
jgi:drug/metabolite transporter (DMT)-like permease